MHDLSTTLEDLERDTPWELDTALALDLDTLLASPLGGWQVA